MLKSVEKLIRDAKYGKKSAKYGNHSMEQTADKIQYFYYWTCICEVDKTTNKKNMTLVMAQAQQQGQ